MFESDTADACGLVLGGGDGWMALWPVGGVLLFLLALLSSGIPIIRLFLPPLKVWGRLEGLVPRSPRAAFPCLCPCPRPNSQLFSNTQKNLNVYIT